MKCTCALDTASRVWVYICLVELKNKTKSSHSPRVIHHSRVASAVNSADRPLLISLSGSLTGRYKNEIPASPSWKLQCLRLIYTMWSGKTKYILNEYGVSIYSGNLLLIGCYFKKIITWSVSCGNSICLVCAGGLQSYSEKSFTGASPEK